MSFNKNGETRKYSQACHEIIETITLSFC